MKAIKPLILSEHGPLLIHTHANGYPPEVYRTFLAPFLDSYQTRAVYQRPFWPGSIPEHMRDWRVFRDDYLEDLPHHLAAAGDQETLIGMGHSLGAMATLMAAIEEPERFQALVLIEPTLFPLYVGYGMRLMAPFNLFRYLHPLVRRTLRRRTVFSDQESMYQNYRRKKIFEKIPDLVLRDYVSGLAAQNPDGTVGLKYSPAWEVQVYEAGGSADHYVWKNLPGIHCPVLVVRGENSDTVTEDTLLKIAAKLSRGQAVTLPAVGHLLPLEAPELVANTVLDFLDAVL